LEYGLLFLEVIYINTICLDLFYECHSVTFYHLERAGKTTYIAYAAKVSIPKEYNIIILPVIFDLRDITDFHNLTKEFYGKLRTIYTNNPVLNISYGKNPEEKLALNIEIFKDLLSDDIIDFDVNNIKQVFINEDLKSEVKKCIQNRYLSKLDLTLVRRTRYLCEHHGIHVVFVLDNFDHLDDHEKVHQAVYSLSREILSKFSRPVFLPMRNYTLKDSYNLYGYVEADKPRNKLLSTPIHKHVFDKRKNYILKNLGDKISLTETVNIKRETLAGSVNTILNGIYRNENVMRFLEGIAGDNIRTYLDIILLALQSGHLQFNEISKNQYSVNYKAFVKACIYCNNYIFRPGDRRCPIISLIDNRQPMGSRNTLARVRLLQKLNHSDATEKVANIMSDFEAIGYTEEDIFSALRVFLYAGLVEEAPYFRVGAQMSSERSFKLTKVGRYYIKNLLIDPAYFEAMAPSLNLPPYYKDNLLNLLSYPDESKRHREIRYNALMKIIAYIENCEQEERTIMKDCHSINKEPFCLISNKLKIALSSSYSEF